MFPCQGACHNMVQFSHVALDWISLHLMGHFRQGICTCIVAIMRISLPPFTGMCSYINQWFMVFIFSMPTETLHIHSSAVENTEL